MEKKLNHYDVEKVIDTSAIESIDNCTVLDEWINALPGELSALDQSLINDSPAELRREERN